ncbi:type II secretion system F family protein [Marinobacterium rhizophilum]|uniref:Type II secretion system F family protein n=1 Tax=Marinobacterium rhizophilum TaxID=420402 RepID=A0ABY5HLD9_9GAMM|nr:type II secretion system F family protein [Marinobacterium rhizophilum]UTW12050.1 type II secretion system F family protein [Marinobacterium rhizophilum]
MMTAWWLDLVLGTALLLFVWALFMLSRDSATPLDMSPDAQGGFRLHPTKLVRQAGIMPQRLLFLYWPIKLLLGALLPLLLLEWRGAEWPVWILAGPALAGFFVPELWLLQRRAQRRRRISDSLSFLIDLIVAYLKAGHNLSQAFALAARYGLTPRNPLAREALLLARELEAGRDREAAFSALATRTGVDDLHRLAAVMNVGFKVGSPVARTLASQADMLRAKQVQRSTELINRKSLEALFPMLLVCLPMFLVLVIFPAAIQFYQMFQWIKVLL